METNVSITQTTICQCPNDRHTERRQAARPRTFCCHAMSACKWTGSSGGTTSNYSMDKRHTSHTQMQGNRQGHDIFSSPALQSHDVRLNKPHRSTSLLSCSCDRSRKLKQSGLSSLQIYVLVLLAFLGATSTPCIGAAVYPATFNIALNKPVYVTPANSTCGSNVKENYCQSNTDPNYVQTCEEGLCDLRCPSERGALPHYEDVFSTRVAGTRTGCPYSSTTM